MNGSQDRQPRVLRITPAIGETNAPYNQFSLAASERQDVTICTYLQPNISVPDTIRVFAGDGSLRGFFRAVEAALKAKEYDVIHAHHPNVSFLLLLRAMFPGFGRMRSTVHTVHSSFPNYTLKHRLMVIPVFALYRRVVFCGRSSFESFPRFYRWLAGSRARVIQNGVDLDRIDRAIGHLPNCAPSDRFKILTAGRLISLKKPMLLLYAFHEAAIPNADLIFVGEGDLKDDLVAETRRLGLQDQVRFTGLVSREVVYEHLVNSDLFVSTSSVEGLPIAVLEAMACKCPVLLSDIPPHREIAGQTAQIPLVPPDDIEGFAREIERFSRIPLEERQQIGEICKKIVDEQFKLSLMHERYEEIYAEVQS